MQLTLLCKSLNGAKTIKRLNQSKIESKVYKEDQNKLRH